MKKTRRKKRRSSADSLNREGMQSNVITAQEFGEWLIKISQNEALSIPEDFLYHLIFSLNECLTRTVTKYQKAEGNMTPELIRYTLFQTLKMMMEELENPSLTIDEAHPFRK